MSEPRDDAAAPPARLVGARYRLGPILGRGGMATVHRATDTRLDREVAVKLLRPEVTADADLAQRFRREALAATVLRHPNIVACLDTGTDEDQPFLVMELVDGEDLAARLKRGGRLAPWQAARIGLDVARALGVAHVRGIVHRDIKPGNILLAADGRAMVTDFGIARLAMDAEASMPGTTLGSVHYFSPEQAKGATTTPASDVYGLGLVLYEALTGARPWSGESNDAIALARVGVAAPSVRTARPEVPEALAAVVATALAPEPGDRYPNGAAMATALERVVGAIDPASPTAVVDVPRGDGQAPRPTATPARPTTALPAGARVDDDRAVGAAAARAAKVREDRRAAAAAGAGVGAGAARLSRTGVLVAVGALLVAGIGATAFGALGGGDRPDPDDPTRPPATGVPATDPAATDPPTPEPEITPAPTSTPEPTPEPTEVPSGTSADLCEPFLDLPCGLGAGTYTPSRFSPAMAFELGDGWSTAAHDGEVIVLDREEGLLTIMRGISVVDPEGEALTPRDRPRDLVEAVVTMDGVTATEPVDVRIGGRRGLSVDLAPVDGERRALFATDGSTFYLEPDRTTRAVAVDVRGSTVFLLIEPHEGYDLRDILDTADPVAGTVVWR